MSDFNNAQLVLGTFVKTKILIGQFQTVRVNLVAETGHQISVAIMTADCLPHEREVITFWGRCWVGQDM